MSWTAEANIRGPKGDKGDPGTPGTPGAPGTSVLPATVVPLVEAGTGLVGVSDKYAREDHVHPLGPGGGGGASVLVQDARPDPLTTPIGSLWWESDTGLLYILYDDGSSKQWVIAVPGVNAASLSAVTYVPQTLTAAQQTVARQNVYAAPLDALAYSGMQINGSMEVSQEFVVNGGGGATSSGRHIAEGWLVVSSGAQVANGTYLANVVPDGFTRSMQLWIGTANASPASTDRCFFLHKIEGYRAARLGWGTAVAQPITIAFWVRTTRPGNYSGAVRNNANDRSYPFNFTTNAVNIWEYKTVTVPGDTGGTWLNDNSVGLSLTITMMAGTSFCAPAGAWTAGNFIGATGTINGVASTSDSMILSGVVVLPGIEAPSAARSSLIMRPYDQELVTCQRYYQKRLQTFVSSYGAAGQTGYVTFLMPTMRITPAASMVGTPIYNNCSALTFVPYSPDVFVGRIVIAAAGPAYADGGTSILDARL